ncbi:MAG TPA: RDD family protein [Nitrososphaeraceae archaeon]|nr:RDD family protein [Nitrososphaeraceae archaeon]
MSNQVPPPNSPGQPSSSGSGGGDTAPPKEILLARWVDRLIAWVIDFVIVNAAVWVVFGLALASQTFFGMDQMMVFDRDDGRDFFFDRDGPGGLWWLSGGLLSGGMSFLITSLVFFGYWTYFEYTRGQSIGKMVMRVKTTDLSGNKPSLKSVMLESFGKSFLLIIDIVLGWIFTDEKRQRIFNRAGNTIVIKIISETTLKDKKGPSNITYRKD